MLNQQLLIYAKNKNIKGNKMIIRKMLKFDASHIVRNCTSRRCSRNIHGHSYKIEIFFEASSLDAGGMIMDFGLVKGTISDFVDGFDHCHQFWSKESAEFKDFIQKTNERWIEMPISPSAEQYSLMFLFVLDKIIQATKFSNGEADDIRVHSVRVHETESGYAESFRDDLKMVNYTLEDIILSKQVQDEFKDPKMYEDLKNYHSATGLRGKPFMNPRVEKQIIE